jgi:hypothetical protein
MSRNALDEVLIWSSLVDVGQKSKNAGVLLPDREDTAQYVHGLIGVMTANKNNKTVENAVKTVKTTTAPPLSPINSIPRL